MPDARDRERILAFIRERFLDNDPTVELDADTPLLEWGILNSMNTAVLLTYIRDEIGVPVPPDRMRASNLKNVHSIAAMLDELAAPAGQSAAGVDAGGWRA